MKNARERVLEACGAEMLERIEHLDRVRRERLVVVPDPPPTPDAGTAVDVDVVIAGGGLWSLLAPVLAGRGLKVLVVERARAGAAHREWNASRRELQALVRAGIVSEAELDELVLARYRHGTCRFQGGEAYAVRDVLDHAVDAGALLAKGRSLAEARSVTFLDGHTVISHASGPDAVAVSVQGGRETRTITARILVDARGASSPYSTGDLVCPTVGGVLTGLAEGDAPDEIDPTVGEILATVDPIEGGRQHVWEAFPGRRGETTVYVFYYARSHEPSSLVQLYARFWDTLPRYKRGDAHMVRPTFGYITGWSRLTPAPAPPPGERVVLVGDAAARHSPLTYCGFGEALRSFSPAADAIVAAAERSGPAPANVMDDAPVHAMTGALAHMLASRSFVGSELNQLLDASFSTLHRMGEETYGRLLRDEASPEELIAFLRGTAQRHSRVWGQVLRGLGISRAGRWGLTALRSIRAATA